MLSNVTCVLQKERLPAAVSLGVVALVWTFLRLNPYPTLPVAEPLRPLGVSSSSVRSGLEERLLLFSDQRDLEVAELPADLGHLVPKGRTNPDGSEVWGYPEGSGLEEVIEVHVKDGRVVREVLRPSSHFPKKALTGS